MKKGTKLKKAIKCLRPTDLEALQSRMRGKKLREIAKEQGITEMGAHQRVQRAAKTLGLENIDQIRKDLFDDTFDDFHRSIKRNLKRLEPSVTNAYGKGFGIFIDQSRVEELTKLSDGDLDKLEQRIVDAAAERGIGLAENPGRKEAPVDSGKIKKIPASSTARRK